MTAQRRPDRVLTGAHEEFWRHCADGELWMQRCTGCALVQWPTVGDGLCERCRREVVWERLSGRGQVVNWCTFERAYYPSMPVPYDTILVELEEGPLFVSNPQGFANDDVTAGMPVRVAFIECEDSAGIFRLPVFERVD
jgi:uncharacterized OB-fold protein